ncbi:MAG: response regulator, partial [Aggregatilineales bacterium]
VMNLVSNAIKFTTEGTVTIRAYAQPYEDNTFIRIDIIDSGIGIAEEDISILFEEFRQVDNSLTRNAEGTGLGLPISKALAELQNGALIVESQINVGSVFSTLIPTQPLEGEEHDDESDESPAKLDVSKITGELESVLDPATQPVSNKIRKVHPGIRRTRNMMPVKREIVLVEDQKEMVDQFRRVLQKEGFEIQTADMPAYARAMVGTMRPTLVILDVNYGDGEGWNVLKDLKEQDATFDIPIIVSTTSTESEEIYQLGANYYLERPVTPTDLLETVLLAEQESRRERILIIDDEPASVRLLSQVLGEYGNYRVFSAKNGVEGISMVARRRPDLIILDLRMPEMDGFAVLEELYNNPETANIPVMVVTGDIDFNADEQEQLQHIHVLPKTHISQEEYDQFLKDVRNHLNPGD